MGAFKNVFTEPVFCLSVENTLAETEYSLKFDESMTEDEIEERSFRSLLPSEAHRRGTKDKSRHQDESEDDGASHSMAVVPRTDNILKVTRQCFQHLPVNSCVDYQPSADSFASACLIVKVLFFPFSAAIVGRKYGVFQWSKQLLTVHNGHGAPVHER